MNRGLGKVAALAAGAALLLAGCTGGGSDPSPSEQASPTASAAQARHCRAVAPRVLSAVQTYVDAYGPAVAGTVQRSVSPATGDSGLRAAIRTARTDIERYGCAAADYRQQISDGLSGVAVRGPMARAVLLRLRSSMNGMSATGAEPVTRAVSPSIDLATVLAQIAPGSTLRLRAGVYRLDEALVLLQGVTLAGQGSSRTVLRSTAPDASVLVLTDGRVDLRRLTLRHAGSRSASVLVGGPSSSISLTDVTVAGGRSGMISGTETPGAGTGRPGGNGVLMSARKDARASRDTTLEVTGSRFAHNDNAGVLLTGGHRASIVRARFDDNECGVCFADESSGAVHRSTFTANTVGVAALGRSRPAVLDSAFSRGQLGLQAAGRAQVVVRRASVAGAARAGLLFDGESGGRVSRSRCSDVRFGIVVAPRAAPYLDRTACTVVRSR